jgi:hypothetical protein
MSGTEASPDLVGERECAVGVELYAMLQRLWQADGGSHDAQWQLAMLISTTLPVPRRSLVPDRCSVETPEAVPNRECSYEMQFTGWLFEPRVGSKHSWQGPSTSSSHLSDASATTQPATGIHHPPHAAHAHISFAGRRTGRAQQLWPSVPSWSVPHASNPLLALCSP